jgi:hypothetical protein
MRISSWTRTRPLRIYSRDLHGLQKVFRMAVGTAAAGEPAAWIAEVEIALDHLLDDQTEEAVFFFELIFIFSTEPLKIIKERQTKNTVFWMTLLRDIDFGFPAEYPFLYPSTVTF